MSLPTLLIDLPWFPLEGYMISHSSLNSFRGGPGALVHLLRGCRGDIQGDAGDAKPSLRGGKGVVWGEPGDIDYLLRGGTGDP